jgi:mono/diheme cytochrome c family protein
LNRRSVAGLAAIGAALLLAPRTAEAVDDEELQRGEYLFGVASCGICHTDTANKGAWLAGGRALKTAFGVFYTPNITPDKEHGIGKWSDADFLKALRKGVGPDGSDYYPVFPYTSFTLMADQDILAIKAYLFTQPAVPQDNRRHQLRFPYSIRLALIPWKILYFREGPFVADPTRSEAWNRGAYLAQAVAHCGECHTPRGALGAVDKSRRLGGVVDGPDGQDAPDITPHPEALGKWSTNDISSLLKDGITPNGDFVGKGMADIVRETKNLTEADRRAIAVYIKSVPPIAPPKRIEEAGK